MKVNTEKNNMFLSKNQKITIACKILGKKRLTTASTLHSGVIEAVSNHWSSVHNSSSNTSAMLLTIGAMFCLSDKIAYSIVFILAGLYFVMKAWASEIALQEALRLWE